MDVKDLIIPVVNRNTLPSINLFYSANNAKAPPKLAIKLDYTFKVGENYPSPQSTSTCTSPPTLQERKKFQCSYRGCKKSFTRRYNLSGHLRYHQLENPYTCVSCPEAFSTKLKLSSHERIYHSEKCVVICGYCNALFNNNTRLNRHLNEDHFIYTTQR